MNKSEENKFIQYLPEGALNFCLAWLKKYPTSIRITGNRKTKLGDFRSFPKPIVSVNGDLSPEGFFFVFTHEMAHCAVFHCYKKRVQPHGNEWKNTFSQMLLESIHIYQPNHQLLIKNHAEKPRASVTADVALAKILFSNTPQGYQLVEELQKGEKFLLDRKIFVLGEKRKKRYFCTELHNGKKYIISPLAEVKKL